LLALFLSFFALLCFGQAPLPSQSSSPATRGTTKATPAAPAAGAEEDEDSVDIPPIARGRISEADYLRLRDQHVGMLRGVNDLARNPQARSQAVRKMETQEKSLRRFGALSSAAVGLAAPSGGPTWFPLGPDPIPNGQTSPSEIPVSGRVTAIAVDPTDSSGDTVYVGTAQGGLYRSLDGGETWTPLMDSALSLAIGAVTIDPLDHTKLFVGTGEGNLSLDSFFGVGVYIIQNATTTANLSGPFNAPTTSPNADGFTDVFTGRSITQILVNPANDNQILVSTSSGASGASGDVLPTRPTRGVYLSTNALSGAATFARQTIQTAAGAANRIISDMAMDPNNPNKVLVHVFGNAVAGDGGVWVSTAGSPWLGNATWTQTLIDNAGGGSTATSLNAKFAVNNAGGTTTFLLALSQTTSGAPCNVNKNGTLSKSPDGTTWTELTAARGFCGGQCSYDMPVAFDPTNAGNILIGGNAAPQNPNIGIGTCGSGILGKSNDGGNTFSSSQGLLHADSHAIAVVPGNPSIIYTGNDGGIFRSNDGGATWISRNTVGFNATQFESLAVHPSDPSFTIGGTQDNGTPFLQPSGEWTRADFGDGGFSAIDQNATDTTNVSMYHTYFNESNTLLGYAVVTTVANATEGSWGFSGCSSPPTAGNGITCSDAVLFYAPLALGPGNPNSVYFGTDRLYRSPDNGNSNTVVSQAPLVPATTGPPATSIIPVSAIGISPQNDNVRIVGMGEDPNTGNPNGHVFATITGANPLTDVTGSNLPVKYIARAVIDPNTTTTAYLTFDGFGTAASPVMHVWKTTNLSDTPGATTWASASGTGTTALPDVPVNALVVDPANSNNVYVGTDIGVFNSIDGGTTWNPYGIGLPRVAVFDMKITAKRTLRIATHGRGVWETATVGVNDDTITLSPSSAHIAFGASVTLTATVNQGAATVTPTGTVTFFDGTNALGSPVTLASGVAISAPVSLTNGVHNLTAVYGGDTNFRSSVSTPTQVGVGALATKTALFAGPANPAVGATVNFTANVDTGSSQALPTGTVTFMENSTALGPPVTLSGSIVARFQTASLSAGTHTITAQYSGDGSFLASTSGGVVVTVGGDFGLNFPNGNSQTVRAGNTATYTINLAPTNGFTGNVGFSCASGLPTLTSCTFNPATVALNGSPASTTLTISTTAPTAAPPAHNLGSGLLTGGGFFALALVLGWTSRKRRHGRVLLLTLGVLAFAAGLVSCGSGGSSPQVNHNPGTPTGTFTVTVNATSGNTTHSSNITLTVQ
jgi:hypothetical protein